MSSIPDDEGQKAEEQKKGSEPLAEESSGGSVSPSPELEEALRCHAERLLARAIDLGAEAGADEVRDEVDLVIATRLALLDQPEFRDPDRIRQLFGAIEEKQRLVEILDRVLEDQGVKVAFGNEVEEPALRNCALVAAPYGDALAPLGVLGVIGPSRMNYARVIPLVEFLSQLLTERLRT